MLLCKLMPSLIERSHALVLSKTIYSQIFLGQFRLDHGFESPDREEFVQLGFARIKCGNTKLDEPLPILTAFDWLNKHPLFSFFDTLELNLNHHMPRINGLECYLAYYVRLVFDGGQRLSSIFPLRSDFSNLPWGHDEFELVTVIATEDKDEPLVYVVTPSSGPSSNLGFMARTGEEVNQWISTNKDGYTFCFPPEAFGPDLLWFMRHKESGSLLLCACQARRYEHVDLGDLAQGVRSLSPPLFWKSKSDEV